MVRRWRAEQHDATDNPYKTLFAHVHPLVIGAVDRAESLSVMLCRELLSYHIANESRAQEIAATLNSKYPSHSYPILLKEAIKIGLKAAPMEADVNASLLELNILEGKDLQVFFQHDKDWYYRVEERRWITMNDESSWRKIERTKGRLQRSTLHVA